MRERIEKTFGVPVLDHYGMGECLMLADSCSASKGLHYQLRLDDC